MLQSKERDRLDDLQFALRCAEGFRDRMKTTEDKTMKHIKRHERRVFDSDQAQKIVFAVCIALLVILAMDLL
jgi:hypothetical protein